MADSEMRPEEHHEVEIGNTNMGTDEALRVTSEVHPYRDEDHTQCVRHPWDNMFFD